MKKKKLIIVLASIMLLSTGGTVFANNIEARKPTCLECGDETYRNYRLNAEYPCSRCGKHGCGKHYWGWECQSCHSFAKESFKGYACE